MTRRRVAIPAILALAVTLAGCQTAGNGTALAMPRAERDRSLKIGITTREDALRSFGEAGIYRFADGSEAWTYSRTTGLPPWFQLLPYVGLIPQHAADRTTELALLFDPKGLLRNVDWRGK